MDREEFLNEIQEILQRDDAVEINDALADYDEWDSLSKMAVMAFFDKQFGKKITLREIGGLKTVKDLADYAGVE